MGRTGAGSGPGAVCVGGRDSRRQGQWQEGIRTGRGNVCVGRRPEGVTTGGTGFGPGGTSYVRAVGGGAAAGEARAAYDAICGAGRRWHAVRRPHACAVAGNPDGWRGPKAGAGGPGGVDSERRCGRGGMVPGIRGSRGGRCARTGPATGCRGLVRGIGSWKNGSAPARGRRPGRDVVTGFGPDAGMRRPGPHTGVGRARAVIACKT